MYTNDEIEKLLTYQTCDHIDAERFTKIRDAAKTLGKAINEFGGEDSDKMKSFQKLRECVFFAIASIVFEETKEEPKNEC